MNELLAARALGKTFYEAGKPLVVLDGLDIAVRAGEVLAVTGPSGVGKSTLLHLLGLLDTPTGGSIVYAGTELDLASESARARIRNSEFGFVFQFYHLLPDFSVLENVLLPEMVPAGWLRWHMIRRPVRSHAMQLLEDLGVADRAHYRPSKLSGGEKQRVAIARALIRSPKIVFCDEPTGNLDERTSEQIQSVLWKINRKNGTTFVIVTHDEELASRCDRVARMHEGRISEVTERKKGAR